MRLIDRSIRPLFPTGYKDEVQVMASVLSVDRENDPDMLAMVGAYAALAISDIPFSGLLGAVKVGKVCIIHTRASRGVDELSAGLELHQRFGVYHPPRQVGQRHVNGDDVAGGIKVCRCAELGLDFRFEVIGHGMVAECVEWRGRGLSVGDEVHHRLAQYRAYIICQSDLRW